MSHLRAIPLIAGAVVCLCLCAQELMVQPAGDQIHVAAPKLQFLIGKPLEKIQNGRAIAFDFQLSALSEARSSVLKRSFERFVISYDLWEEKFSVTRMRSKGSSASRLTARAAETWCLENIMLPSAGLPADAPIWVRLDIRAQETKQRTPVGEEGIALSTLVEIFSRAGNDRKPDQWRVEAGPVRLADLRTPSGRGAD